MNDRLTVIRKPKTPASAHPGSRPPLFVRWFRPAAVASCFVAPALAHYGYDDPAHTSGVTAVSYSQTFDNPPIHYKAKIAAGEGDSDTAWRGRFKVDDPWGVQSLRVTIAPGGWVGWHSHANLTFLSIAQGEMTVYFDVPPGRPGECDVIRVPTGKTFMEGGHGPSELQYVRNERDVALIIDVTSIVPTGAMLRTDYHGPMPQHCPDLTQPFPLQPWP